MEKQSYVYVSDDVPCDPDGKFQAKIMEWRQCGKTSFKGFSEIFRHWSCAHLNCAPECVRPRDISIIAKRMGVKVASCPTLTEINRLCLENAKSFKHPGSCECSESRWGSWVAKQPMKWVGKQV